MADQLTDRIAAELIQHGEGRCWNIDDWECWCGKRYGKRQDLYVHVAEAVVAALQLTRKTRTYPDTNEGNLVEECHSTPWVPGSRS